MRYSRSSSSCRWRQQQWCPQPPLEPLMEGPDPEMLEDGNKKESSWELIREWFGVQKSFGAGSNFTSSSSFNGSGVQTKIGDLRLLLGVLGCPLAPIPLASADPEPPLHLKSTPIETSIAHYIIQQYLAATGSLKRRQKGEEQSIKNMYASGRVKMICCETEISSAGKTVKSLGTRSEEGGCFVLWQMSPGMWSLELVVAGHKLIAGSDGKIVWRHTPWLGTHAAKGPQRPLRRIIQGLDPRITASLFLKARCLGEKRIGEEDCFVLKVAADREAVMERSEGPAEVMRHVLYGYFSQKSGLLVYLEDSHLTRVDSGSSTDESATATAGAVYWETTIGSTLDDYREVLGGAGCSGVCVAHAGRSIATVFRFGEDESMQYSRSRMEEEWQIDDVDFNVPGLSLDYFIPPADIFHDPNTVVSPNSTSS
ncbi:hypothetical protein SAY87_032011 [Trapa incisa]|uniref:C-type mannose receptor 2 n=1 Tax=Trapa incisa TaxID=236973 RepID=A0AAN7KUA7_9MYRT|nr:hypothetical protein SAY87_032011 [Trapa incisa]